MKIIITQRIHDYHVMLEGQPEIWACGKNADEAIGDLIRSHPKVFSITIENR